MPADVQISLLRRMPLLPGGAVMTLSVIILTTSELTSPLHEYEIQIKLLIENKLIICTLGNLLYCKFPKAQIMSLFSINKDWY